MVLCRMNSNKKDEGNYWNQSARLVVVSTTREARFAFTNAFEIDETSMIANRSLAWSKTGLDPIITRSFPIFHGAVAPRLLANEKETDAINSMMIYLFLVRIVTTFVCLILRPGSPPPCLSSLCFSSSSFFFRYGQCHIFTIYRINGAWHVRISESNLTNFFLSLTR